MHRDYSDVSGDIMVEIFQDRIIVSNPGGLVPWLRPEDFGKYSRTRNRVIASLLMRTPYAEKMGTGILRIQRELAEAALPPAQFCFDEYNFAITLSVGPS
jgi:ATP-dependent DNA helicase RecG